MKDKSGKPEDQQYVTFLIDKETYGIEVNAVKEIISLTEITPVPNTRDFMKGVINLRGTVVPVVDMRKKFNMEEVPYSPNTVIIIVEFIGRLIGLVVDSVSDVINFPSNSIQGAVTFKTSIDKDLIQGISRVNDLMIIIIDINYILKEEDLESIDSFQDSHTDE